VPLALVEVLLLVLLLVRLLVQLLALALEPQLLLPLRLWLVLVLEQAQEVFLAELVKVLLALQI
jgi:hypothetical protein